LGRCQCCHAAEKATKSAETKAKKTEKALADTDQKRVQQEQAIAERLDNILVLVGSKCRIVLFLSTCSYFYLLIFARFLLLFSFCGAAEKIGVSWKLRQPDAANPLLAAVDLLESNWKLVKDVL
jgi:hypothetical protein